MSIFEALGWAAGWLIGPLMIVLVLFLLALAAFSLLFDAYLLEDYVVAIGTGVVLMVAAITVALFAASNGIHFLYWWVTI